MRRGSPAMTLQPAVVEPAGERLALDDELDFEAGQQDLVEHPDDQLGLTDGETPHRGHGAPVDDPAHTAKTLDYTPASPDRV